MTGLLKYRVYSLPGHLLSARVKHLSEQTTTQFILKGAALMDEDLLELWLRKDGIPEIYIGPFCGKDAPIKAQVFRLNHLAAGFYITRQPPPQVFPPHAIEYVKKNLL
jgi:hypothetical protein